MTQSKADIIDERKANLPLPDDPQGPATDLQSASGRTTDIGSGAVSSSATTDAGRGPPTSASHYEGRAGENKVPDDAITGNAKVLAKKLGTGDEAGLKNTTNPDKGYPESSDPSEGIKK